METRNNDTCKVSIIVPVYRVEKYIDKCMKSLLKQTLKDIEILCVCEEEDSSYKKLLTYEKEDNRVHIITKKNTGVSAARNAGIRAAGGEYIAFVDADDWIERYALKMLYQTAERYNTQIIAYGIWPAKEPKGDKRGMFSWSPTRNVLYYTEGMRALFYEHGSRPYVINKFYRRRFLMDNQIFFNEAIDIGEDQLFQFEAFDRAENICFLKNKLYHYNNERIGSAMTTCEERHEIEEKNFLLLQTIMNQKKKEYGVRYDREYVLWILHDYGDIINRDEVSIVESRKKEIIAIQEYLREMSAEKYIGDLPKEYQCICERFLNYPASKTEYGRIYLPYKAYEIYLNEQSEGFYEKMPATGGFLEIVKRIYEAIVFHEFRHLATKALVRFGMF